MSFSNEKICIGYFKIQTSYNSAYREDTQSTMSNVILEYTRTVANEIRETFLSAPPVVVIPPEELNPTYTRFKLVLYMATGLLCHMK